ncbi:hypothetical protein D779_2897 [Imhoffiella purpurea]|uniref:Uncharacterized protein n=1 Tax=Imhoffiella purpurea TaxID=1249627 RepID=W9VB89_9GAMM|nr:hypothetical protein D779_2897 [Imhoffiella purpurea]
MRPHASGGRLGVGGCILCGGHMIDSSLQNLADVNTVRANFRVF